MTLDGEDVVLRDLTYTDEVALLRAVAAATDSPSILFAPGFDPAESFAEYVELLRAQARGERLPPRWVPSRTMFAFCGGTIVGRLQLRLLLNEFLLRYGGHIGYVVLPQFRNRGFAQTMLRQGLAMARDAGIGPVLLTCDEGNASSAHVIEKAGGVLENILEVLPGAPRKRRYWIHFDGAR
jgi:predicted acetyltransferase